MTDQEHIQGLVKEFSEMMKDKYMKGAKEHGGHLWEKDGMLENALEEVTDLAVYLLTLKHKRDDLSKSINY
jgi:hypothetical protein